MLKLVAVAAAFANASQLQKKHHKKHHHKKAGAVQKKAAAKVPEASAAVATAPKTAVVADLKKLAATMEAPSATAGGMLVNATLQVAGPITPDFPGFFSHEAAEALTKAGMKCASTDIKVTASKPVDAGIKADGVQVLEISFTAPAAAAHAIKLQAATENSPLASGPLEKYLSLSEASVKDAPPPPPPADQALEIDGEMPFGQLEPFGREDTANELTASSIKESDAMVDQMERAEVAEEKRSVFRALTRLRGAAITSFDGVARSQTGNIDEYNHTHQWRLKHPLKHLAAEESDASKWAFPSHD